MSIPENLTGNLIILTGYYLTGLVNFANIYNAQQHSFGVQFWQGDTASWLKSIQAGYCHKKSLFTLGSGGVFRSTAMEIVTISKTFYNSGL